MFVEINCRSLFYVYFKPLTIQIGWELNKLFIFRKLWKFDVQLLRFLLFYLFLNQFLSDLDENYIKI